MSKSKRDYAIETALPSTIRLKQSGSNRGKNGANPRTRRKQREKLITPDLIWRIIERIKEL